jgi:[protein-PII] uridylyltransferase
VYGGRQKRAPIHEPPRVVVDNRASRDATVVEVHAADSIGVLYRITRALAELDLDIVSAKVQTLGDRVVDAFYVRDVNGGKLDDPMTLVEVERALLHELVS